MKAKHATENRINTIYQRLSNILALRFWVWSKYEGQRDRAGWRREDIKWLVLWNKLLVLYYYEHNENKSLEGCFWWEKTKSRKEKRNSVAMSVEVAFWPRLCPKQRYLNSHHYLLPACEGCHLLIYVRRPCPLIGGPRGSQDGGISFIK